MCCCVVLVMVLPAMWCGAQLANFILHSVYMGTTNSGDATRRRAKQLAAEIGGMHLDANIDAMVSAVLTVVEAILGAVHRPKFEAHGGTYAQDVALQNVQVRGVLFLHTYIRPCRSSLLLCVSMPP